ncbi:hypothetical protein [Streptomyces sp. NPDC015125]|uniref:hypothetical protein n=1 Tax=Streptomyces sp. NPDC015125 TaxID=3364938 RepID=UPI0036FE997D
MSNAKIGVALIGGYLLGRTKKAKMAIGLGMFLAGKKLNLDPRQLGALVANSPVLGPLHDQVRKELVDATKSAAGAALNQRMNGLADSLHERTLALDEGGTDGAGRAVDDANPEPEDEARDVPRGEAEETDDAADAEGEKPAPRRKTSAKSSAKSSANPSGNSATKTASAKKSTATDRPSQARRSASSAAKTSGKAVSSRARTSTAPGRKAASGARSKASSRASGAARTVADRGGSNG